MSAPLDSRQLKAFLTLARTGSFTETARRLFLTHSAISHSMRALEIDIGCRLLRRESKKVTLTEAGEALLHHAERIIAEMEQARSALQDLNKWGFRRLRLATDAALWRQFLASVLVKLQSEFPHLLIDITQTQPSEAPALLEACQVDLVLGAQPPRNDPFEFTPLFHDRLHIVVPESHPWAKKGHVPREELPSQPCILGGKTNLTRRLVDRYFAADKIVLNTVIEVDSLEAIKEFVKQGLGVSILPAWLVRQELAEASLVALPLGKRHLTQTWGILQRQNGPLDHVHTIFLKLCRSASTSIASIEANKSAPLN
jgi:DNA-binding transcriptional LysR family regulator